MYELSEEEDEAMHKAVESSTKLVAKGRLVFGEETKAINMPEDELKQIAVTIANYSHMPYIWEDIMDRLRMGDPMPFKINKPGQEAVTMSETLDGLDRGDCKKCGARQIYLSDGLCSDCYGETSQDDREQLISAMKAMVEAQHAGPITDEMLTAWTNAKALLTILEWPGESSHDGLTDKEIALGFLWQIDEAECSLQAWDLICNAKEYLDDH